AQLAEVKQVIVQHVATRGAAVLNAEDPLVVAMADVCPGSVVYFGNSARQPVLAEHRTEGGRVVYRDGDQIVAAEGGLEVRIDLAGVPVTRGGVVPFQAENVMAAVAAGWSLGIDWDVVRRALAGFVSDAAT